MEDKTADETKKPDEKDASVKKAKASKINNEPYTSYMAKTVRSEEETDEEFYSISSLMAGSKCKETLDKDGDVEIKIEVPR